MGTIATVTIGTDVFSVYAITTDAVVDATAFFNGQLGAATAAWTAATADNKKRSLVMAANWIDRAMVFSGEKTVSTQARAWPRDGATCNGEAITDGTTPSEVAYAEFVLAGILLQDATAADSAGTGSNIKSVGAGSAQVSFFSPTVGGPTDVRLPVPAWDYLKCLVGSTSSLGAALANGTDVCSDFTADDWERSGGFA